MMAKNYSDLYGPEEKDTFQYEVVKLPLQNHISTARKFLSAKWGSFKVEKNKAKSSLKRSLQNASNSVQDAAKSVGVKNGSVALQAGAVGSAAIGGVYLARKKSMVHRMVYPALAGVLVWGAFYCSALNNRSYIHSQMKSIWTGYFKNTKSNK